MQFQAKSVEEIKELADSKKLLPKGIYSYEIEDAWDKISAASNEMIELRVLVSNGNGLSRTLSDYLVAKRPDKLRSAASSFSALDRYEAGELVAADCAGKRGHLRVGVEKKRGFPDRNVIEAYLPA